MKKKRRFSEENRRSTCREALGFFFGEFFEGKSQRSSHLMAVGGRGGSRFEFSQAVWLVL